MIRMEIGNTNRERINRARNHTEEMEQKYEFETDNSIRKTKIYSTTEHLPGRPKTAELVVENLDSVSAAIKYQGGGVALHNFASFFNPGGGFMNGSESQEEALCHSSNLYNVLIRQMAYYFENRDNANNSLYRNRAIYSPEIIFEQNGEKAKIDVITCAAPNWASAQDRGISYETNLEALKSRLEFIKYICQDNKVSTLITGAWGCGVFGQDPEDVARCFKEVFSKSPLDKVVFAIIGDDNYETFKEIIERSEND